MDEPPPWDSDQSRSTVGQRIGVGPIGHDQCPWAMECVNLLTYVPPWTLEIVGPHTT